MARHHRRRRRLWNLRPIPPAAPSGTIAGDPERRARYFAAWRAQLDRPGPPADHVGPPERVEVRLRRRRSA
jgi:hypothetical protein